MYAGPPWAEVELVLPVGYRGPVLLRREATDELAAGRRRYPFAVAPTGHVVVRGPRLLTDTASSPDITARYADGPPLPTDHSPGTIRLRRVTSHGDTGLYVVGTAADEQAVHDTVYPQKPPGSGTRHFDREAYGRLFVR